VCTEGDNIVRFSFRQARDLSFPGRNRVEQ
jgi:hypothetical protein